MPPTWTPASDLGERIRQLREDVLGETQTTFGKRFGVEGKQVSAWENGHQAPRPKALERVSSVNGWNVRMFAKGGPMPNEVLKPAFRRESGGTNAAVEGLTRTADAATGDPFRDAVEAMMEMMRRHLGAVQDQFGILEKVLLGTAKGDATARELIRRIQRFNEVGLTDRDLEVLNADRAARGEPPIDPPRDSGESNQSSGGV